MDINLTEDQRKQLDGIVQQMENEGQQPSYIQAVVDDFKKVKSAEQRTSQIIGEYRKTQKIPEWAGKNKNLYGVLGAAKSLYDPTIKETINALGATAGAAAGTPEAPGLGTLAGSAIGYGIASNINSKIQSLINDLEGKEEIPKTLKSELIKSIGDIKDGLVYEMMGQSIGKAVIGTATYAAAPYEKHVSPHMKDIAKKAKNFGIKLTPADITQSKSMGLAESIMEKAMGSSDIIRDMRINSQLNPMLKNLDDLRHRGAPGDSIDDAGKKIYQEVTDYLKNKTQLGDDALNNMRTEVLSKLGTNRAFSEIGLEGKELLKARTILTNQRANELYQSIGDFVPNQFDTPELNKTAQNLLKRKQNLPAQDKQMLNILEWSAKELDIPQSVLKEIDGLPAEVQQSIINDIGSEFKVKKSWKTLQDFYQDMNSLIKNETATQIQGMKFSMTPKGNAYTQLKRAAAIDMKNAAKNAGNEAYKQFELANAFYSEASDVYKSNIIRKIANTDPEKIIDIGFKPNGISEILLMKRALGNKGFDKLREGFTNKLMGVGKFDTFNPEYLRKELMRYGDDTLKNVYGEQSLYYLKKISRDGIDLSTQTPGFKFLQKLSKTYPETIVDSILGAPETKLQSKTLVNNIRTLKKAVSEKEFNELGDKFFDKMIHKFEPEGVLKARNFANMVDKYGERTLNEFYKPNKVKKLIELGDIARVIETSERIAGNPSGTGQTLISWSTMRLMISNPVTGSVVAITPKQFAKLYTSEFGMQWLTDGFKIPSSSITGAKLYTRIMSIVGGDKLKENNNGER